MNLLPRVVLLAGLVPVLASLSCSRPEPPAATKPPRASEEAAPPSEPELARSVEVMRAPKAISVGLKDFDLLLRGRPKLNASLRFEGSKGEDLGRLEVDYAVAAARSHFALETKEGSVPARMTLTLRNGKKKLMEERFPVPSAANPSPALPTSGEKAFVVPGTATPRGALPEETALPDYAKARALTLPDASRRWNLEGSVKRIASSLNYPSMGANNNSVVSLQTAHPTDLSKRSHYDSVKSTLYDPKTGAALSTLKYLVEIPLDENWRLGDDDLEVTLPSDRLRVHISQETLDGKPGSPRITGVGTGGLMQGVYTVAADDEGNLYFSESDELIRFHLRKNRWEKAPVRITEYASRFLPKPSEVPASEGKVKSVGWSGSALRFQVFYGGNDRLFLSFGHSYFQDGHLACAAVLSVPTRDWEDAAAFEKGIRLNAASWPTAAFPLYPTWLPSEGDLRHLKDMAFIQGRIGMLAYDKNHFWVMDVDAQGNTTRLLKLTEVNGKKIAAFDYPKAAHGAAGFLGILTGVEAGPEREKLDLLLPAKSAAWEVPPTGMVTSAHFQSYQNKVGARIRAGTQVYGMREYSKETLASLFGKADFGKGTVRVCYDVVDWMRRNPAGIEDLLAQMNGPSLGPQFLVAAIPGEDGKALGCSEYGGYYFSVYDWSGAGDAPVRKTHLFKATDAPIQIPLGAALGPYCHAWQREGDADVLCFAGYTGIGRMPVRKSGKLLARTQVEPLGKAQESADGAPMGYTMWYRAILPGLGSRLWVTGVAQAARHGNAYSGGLGWLDLAAPGPLRRLTGMTAGHYSIRLASRLVAAPNGRLAQEVYLPASFASATDLKAPPANQRPKLFVFRDDGSGKVEDRFGYSLAAAADEGRVLSDFGVARNQLYGIVLFADGTLATLDLAEPRFADAVRLANRIQSYDRGVDVLNPLPDGSHLLCTADTEKRSVTFHRVDVDAAGRLGFEPLLTCDLGSSGMYPNWKAGEFDLVPDLVRQDGSYDLVMGARYPQEEGAQVFVIPDVIPPRTAKEAAAAEGPRAKSQ